MTQMIRIGNHDPRPFNCWATNHTNSTNSLKRIQSLFRWVGWCPRLKAYTTPAFGVIPAQAGSCWECLRNQNIKIYPGEHNGMLRGSASISALRESRGVFGANEFASRCSRHTQASCCLAFL